MLKRNWADLLFAQKCCIFALARPRTSRQTGTSSVSFYPDRPNTRPGEGATTCRIVFSKCFVVFPTCRIVFRKCLLASPKQPAECSRKLNTLKLKPLGRPFSGAKGQADSRQKRGMRRAAGGRCRRGGRKRTAGRTKEAAGAAKEQAREAKESAGTAKRTAGTAKEQAGESEKERGEDERERGKDERDRQGQRKRPRGQRKSREAAGIKPIGAPEALIFR